MHTLSNFLSADDPLYGYIGERYLIRYKSPLTGRLDKSGLEQLVKEVTKEEPRLDTAYLFFTMDDKVGKILIRDEVSTKLLDLHGKDVDRVLELCEKLGV